MFFSSAPSPSSSSSFSSVDIKEFLGQIYSRRLLLHSPFHKEPTPAAPPSSNSSPEMYMGDSVFDANVVMILAVLLCALICALGLNSIIRCALRCSSRRTAAERAAARDANTGIKKKALKTFPIVTYSAELNLPGLASECLICLSEFAQGEKVKVLPKCHHGFHAKCIDKWLGSHSTCPTCRQCLLETCKKIVGSREARSSESVPALQSVIVPLEPEGLMGSHRGAC